VRVIKTEIIRTIARDIERVIRVNDGAPAPTDVIVVLIGARTNANPHAILRNLRQDGYIKIHNGGIVRTDAKVPIEVLKGDDPGEIPDGAHHRLLKAYHKRVVPLTSDHLRKPDDDRSAGLTAQERAKESRQRIMQKLFKPRSIGEQTFKPGDSAINWAEALYTHWQLEVLIDTPIPRMLSHAFFALLLPTATRPTSLRDRLVNARALRSIRKGGQPFWCVADPYLSVVKELDLETAISMRDLQQLVRGQDLAFLLSTP
jgi:hypothetical protein